MRRAAAVVSWLALAAWPALAFAHDAGHDQRLPVIGRAADFALDAAGGERVTLRELRGKVVAVAFIYTTCPDICPLLTDKMAAVKDALGRDFGTEVAFVSITVDPEHDTPAVLRDYAQAFGADVPGWWFVTGTPAEIRAVARGYGVVVISGADGSIDHTLLTTLVDRQGRMRVQYLGARFDPDELRRDLVGLAREP